MKNIFQQVMSIIGILVVCGSISDVSHVFAKGAISSNNQEAAIIAAAKQCPKDLSPLRPKMEKALQFIKSAKFKETMRSSLQASIPQAIIQSDGLTRQIAFLEQEIMRQEKERSHAEQIAREGLADSSQPLKPCRHKKESAYCYAMDQYLASIAANLANQGFLDALQCYQREGVR